MKYLDACKSLKIRTASGVLGNCEEQTLKSTSIFSVKISSAWSEIIIIIKKKIKIRISSIMMQRRPRPGLTACEVLEFLALRFHTVSIMYDHFFAHSSTIQTDRHTEQKQAYYQSFRGAKYPCHQHI